MDETAVNFLPEDYVEKRVASRWSHLSIGLCIAVMCGVCGTFVMEWRANLAAQEQLNRVSKEYEEEGKKIAEIHMLEDEQERLATKAEVTSVLKERVPRSALLAEFTRLMPKGVDLMSVDLKTRDATEAPRNNRLEAARQQLDGTPENQAVPRPPEKEVTIELVGMAPTDGHVAAFISALGKSPVLEDVNLVYSEEFKFNDETLRRFRVEMRINPDADLDSSIEDEPAKGQKG
jgi:Tfp pilus assembly protein PilN